jgi:GcrA cell cycle regulator
MLPIGFNRIPRRRAAPLWTKPDTERLKVLWSQGVSATRISRTLPNGVSRSAVLAKIYRLGIGWLSPRSRARERRFTARKPGAEPRPLRRSAADPILLRPARIPSWVTAAVPYMDDPLVDADVPVAQRRSLLELSNDTCRWPVGDPERPGFFFCGAVPLPDKPYCAAHCARSYLPETQQILPAPEEQPRPDAPASRGRAESSNPDRDTTVEMSAEEA